MPRLAVPALGGDFQLHTKSICICFFYGQLDSYYSYYIIHRVILPSKFGQVAGIFGLNGWCREPNSSHASHENSQDGWKPDERVSFSWKFQSCMWYVLTYLGDIWTSRCGRCWYTRLAKHLPYIRPKIPMKLSARLIEAWFFGSFSGTPCEVTRH